MASFLELPFDSMNEADVREEVICELVKTLGYRTGTSADVVREQGLRYSHLYIGRKDPQRDPVLRGKADYILEVNKRVRWVIEAKAPSVELGLDDIEQAWSYANHAEVRAVYFVLCNGRRLVIYSTNHGPAVPPLLDVPYEQLSDRLGDISNFLSPSAIERDFPDLAANASPPIGPGLRSIVRISSGVIRYLKSSQPNNPALTRIQTFITEGAVERNGDGNLVAYLKTYAPIREMQELNERLGYDGFEMRSPDSTISTDALSPTVFTNEMQVTLPRGTLILDMNTWQQMPMPFDVTGGTVSQARGILAGKTFSGDFVSKLDFGQTGIPPVVLEGDFFIHLV